MLGDVGRKPVLVQMSDELVAKLDVLSEQLGRSRSAIVRDAAERYVAQESIAEKDRRTIEGYKRNPPSDEFDDWAEAGAKRLLEDESW